MAESRPRRGLRLKRWFNIHVWSALATLLVVTLLAVTGIFIYPSDQLRLRDIHVESPWLPPLYERNGWGAQLKSIAITDKGWIATHRQGVFMSEDEGQTWRDITPDIPGEFVAGEGLFPPVVGVSPSDSRTMLVSKGRGVSLTMNGGDDWEDYGESFDEDLSTSGIMQLAFAPGGIAVAIDESGFVYRRFLDEDEDEGWELSTLALPFGDEGTAGRVDWATASLNLHNGQVFLGNDWWLVNHAFAFVLLGLAYTGVVLWWRRVKKRLRGSRAPQRLRYKVLRQLHRAGGMLSWPLLYLLPITGIVLLHVVDFSALTNRGLPVEWFPERYDANSWKGPVELHLRNLAISRSNGDHMWAGHTYGLFATEDGGQSWENVGESLGPKLAKQVDHLFVGPGWLNYIFVGDERGVQVSRNFGGQWARVLERPVDAMHADRRSLYVVSGDTLLALRLTSLVSLETPAWEETVLAPPYGQQQSVRATTLYQLLHDAHSGKLFGTWFKYVLDVVAILMVVQTLTGLVLWIVPRWRRLLRARHQARRRRLAHASS